jgi:hypothetical protein
MCIRMRIHTIIHMDTIMDTIMDMRIRMNTPMLMAPHIAIHRRVNSVSIRATCITALARRTPTRPV